MSAALDPVAAAVLRAALAWLLLSTALHKARDAAGFRAALAGYALLPQRAVAAAAAALAGAEAGLGAALLVPGSGPAPAAGAAALFALYAAAMLAALAAGRRGIACGCGGPAGGLRLGPAPVARSALLVAAALAAALPAAARPLVWLDAVTLAGGVAALASLYCAAELSLAQAARAHAWRAASPR